MAAFSDTEKLSAIEALIEDLKSKGGTFSSDICVKEDESGGYGIFSNSSIFENSVLVSIPFDICLSAQMVAGYGALDDIFQDNPGLTNYPDEVLCIGMMHVKSQLKQGFTESEVCPWFHHVKTFPDSFNTTLYWTDEELIELKDCTIFHLTKMMKNQIRQDWEQLHQPLVEQYPHLLGSISIEDYTWALSIVYSRCVGFNKAGTYVRCIPPILDMANHFPVIGKCADDTLLYDDVLNQIKLVSVTDKNPNEECFAIYGNYPNAKLLYSYGFILPNNPHKAIDVWTRVSPQTLHAQAKQQILTSHPLTKEQTYDFDGTIRENYISAALLVTIRVIQANEEELPYVEKAYQGEMISPRNEAASYVALRNLLVAKMKVEQAEADRLELGSRLLDGSAILSDRKLMALMVRVEERDLMQDALSMLDGWIALLAEKGDLYETPDKIIR